MSTSRSLPLLVTLLVLVGASSALAAPFRIGVVVSQLGSGAAAGGAQAAVARAFTATLNYGAQVEILVRDDVSDPNRTLALVEELVEEEGVHALVCCTLPAAAAAVAPYLEAQRVPTLSLGRLPETASGHWFLLLPPKLLTQMRALAVDARRLGGRAGLLTLDTPFGADAQAALADALLENGVFLAKALRYPPDATVLTPEGLQVAASQPDSVVVWGLPRDVPIALAGLRERGYDGPVYAPPALIDPLAGGLDPARLAGVRFPVAPATVAAEVPPTHPSYGAVQSYLRLVGPRAASAPGALAFDALTLLSQAYEQALGYGLEPDRVATFRQALWDALVGLPPIAGAAGVYDFDGRDPWGAEAAGLLVVTSERGRLIPSP